MFKKILTLFLISTQALAGLPPTTSKVSGDTNPVTTFNYDFSNFTGTHTGTTTALGVLSVAGGGTGSGTQNFVDLTTNQSIAGTKTLTGQTVNSLTGAASTPSLYMTGSPYTAGTATTNKPLALLEDAATSTGWSTAGTYLGVNAKTGFSGNLIDLQLNGSSKFKVNMNGSLNAQGLTSNTLLAQSAASTLGLQNSNNSSTANLSVITAASSTYSQTSGTNAIFSLLPTYNQSSGTAANTDLLINRTQTAVGSGAQNLIDAQVGGVSKFKVDNAGNVTVAGTISSASNTYVPPTTQTFTTGTAATYNKNYTFIISSGSATVGATYTNNAVTFTVYATVASSTQVVMSGSGAPASSGTLTKASGTGDATLTFSQVIAPNHLKVRMVGGGGGGGGGGSSGQGTGGTGGTTTFNSVNAIGGSGGVSGPTGTGSGGSLGGIGGTGGTGTATFRTGGGGGGDGSGGAAATFNGSPGAGGASLLGGGGVGAGSSGAGTAQAGQGYGGGGGGGNMGSGGRGAPGGGGGGEYVELVIASPAATYTYTVGAGGTAGSAGTGGGAGGAGGGGVIVVQEFYQ